MITKKDIKRYRKNPLAFLEEQYILENGKLIKLESWQKHYIFEPILFTRPVCIDCPHLRDISPKKLKLETSIKVCSRRYNQDKCPNKKEYKKQKRYYRRALISLCKKEGKSTMGGCFAEIGLFIDHVRNEAPPEVYGAAGDKDQAKIIWKRAWSAIARNDDLNRACKLLKTQGISVKATGAVYKPVSSESKTKHGLNPSMKIFDEVWNQGDDDLIEALADSPVRKQPLTIFLTYAGIDKNTPLGRMYDKGKKHEDKKMFFYWSHANIASWKSKEFLVDERGALSVARYTQYYENGWTSSDIDFIKREEIMACVGYPPEWPEAHGPLRMRLVGEPSKEYVLAIDLAFLHDRTALALGHIENNFIFLDHIKKFVPHPKAPIKIEFVLEYVLMLLKRFTIKQVVLDPYGARQLIAMLENLNYPVEQFNFKRSQNLVTMQETLWTLIHTGYLRIPQNKSLIDEFASVRKLKRSYGIRIDTKSGGFDDQVIAVGMLSLSLLSSETPHKPQAALMGSVKDDE